MVTFSPSEQKKCFPSVFFPSSSFGAVRISPFLREPCVSLLMGLGIQCCLVLHVCPAWEEVLGRSPGTPHIGDLLRLGSVVEAQVFHVKDKEALLVPGKA